MKTRVTGHIFASSHLARIFTHPWIASWLFLVLLATGCSQPFQPTPNPFEIDAREYRRMYNAAVLILREQGFRLNRQDYRFATVSTYPLACPTLFEPWRPTNTTAGQAFEATINQQRRIVTVRWESIPRVNPSSDNPTTSDPAPPERAYLMHVEVVVERRQEPTRHLNGSTQGHAVTSSLTGVPVEWFDRGITESDYWQPIGTDPYLEQRLTAAIVRKSLDLQLLKTTPRSANDVPKVP